MSLPRFMRLAIAAGAHLTLPGTGSLRADGKGHARLPVDFNSVRGR